MSLQINLDQPPFSFLEKTQLDWLKKRLDLVFFRKGDVVLDIGQTSPGIYIVYKGVVEETGSDGQVFTQYGVEDLFDVRAALESACKHRFTALEETLCYLLKASDFVELLNHSQDFSIYFQTDLGTQQSLVDQRGGEVSEFILAKIDKETMREPVYVPAQTSLSRIAQMMKDEKHDALLVRDGDRQGIVTGSDLLNAVLINGIGKEARVTDIACFDLVTVEEGEYLFNALLKMTQHHIERVVVTRDGEVTGILELMDMLSTFSTHSHIVAMRIEQARTIEDLIIASGRLESLIANLSGQGVKVIAIMSLITTLNRRLMAKAFDILIPEKLKDKVCLLVLGSEGRGEQILKTDQDNAIVIEDEHVKEALMPSLQKLHQVLLDFGYPRCPGGVMFINDAWIHTEREWQQRVNRWLNNASPEAMMNMAILMDAEPVAGNIELFSEVRSAWHQESLRSSIAASWFARPALLFETPLTLLGNIREDHGSIDIKKGGIFPIVHGIRALAFEHGLYETNTIDRLDKLTESGILSVDVAQGLKDSLILFLRIRLRYQLEQDDKNRGLNHKLPVSGLRSVDRSLLRHGLHRVKKFKQWLISHYHLENL
jgi:CBS domain-containing protein